MSRHPRVRRAGFVATLGRRRRGQEEVCYQNPGKLKSWKRAHLAGATGAGNSYIQSADQSGERVEQKYLTSLSPSHSLQHPANVSHC